MKSLFAILWLFPLTTFAAAPNAYTPNEALADALSSPLHLVGKGALYGYETVESCLYKNDKVLVLNGYCISPEAPAADLQIYSPSRGQVLAVHAESLNNATPISLTNPRNYPPQFWYLYLGTTEKSEISLDISFADFTTFYGNRYSNIPPNCIVGYNGRKCDASLNEFASSWLPAATSFRKNPSPSWKRILDILKKLPQ